MEKRCNGCMRMKTQSPICEHCGYNEYIDNLPHQLPIGTLLREQYRIGKVLGQGGFGITYLGWDENLDVPVAIKEFYPNGTVNRESSMTLDVTCGGGTAAEVFQGSRERFLREARIQARLRSIPEIVHVQNFFQENNTAYIIMEYVPGVTLKNYVSMRGGRISVQETLALLTPVIRALERIHAQELVHRDISPDNIMMQPDGTIKLLDFGAARDMLADNSTVPIVKHGYAPIEQYQRQGNLGPWTDVYALCGTIHYCLTGETPPEAPQRMAEGLAMNWADISGLTEIQREALEKGMEMVPQKRIRSVRELSEALYQQKPAVAAAADSGEPSETKPEDTSGQQPEDQTDVPDDNTDKEVKRRSKLPILIAAAALLLVAALLLPSFLDSAKASPKPDMAGTVPTQRVMAGDCSTVLKQADVSGKVLDLDVREENLHEKYQTLVVTCEVAVLEGGEQVRYLVELHYEYEDETWVLSDLSKVQK